MARNYNNDQHGGILRKNVSAEIKTLKSQSSKFDKLNKRPKYLVLSFIAIAAIIIISFLIPEKYYDRDMDILLLNLELIILFTRDIVLYFKKSCKIFKVIILLMLSIYLINVVDLLFNIPNSDYLGLGIILITAALSFIYMLGFKK